MEHMRLERLFFGALRPGDMLVCATGMPYDTMIQVIGIDECGPAL